jgi:hypothetical protein
LRGKRVRISVPRHRGTLILTLESVPGDTFPLSAAVPPCKGKRRDLRPASVDPIEKPTGSRGGEEISIIIQGSGSSRRRRALGPIPELEVAKNFFDDRRVFDATDDA